MSPKHIECLIHCVIVSLKHRHPELIRGDWVKPGAIVVDVGINVVNPPSSSHNDSPPMWPSKAVSTLQHQTPGSHSAPWIPGTYCVVGDVAFDEVAKVKLV